MNVDNVIETGDEVGEKDPGKGFGRQGLWRLYVFTWR